MRVCRLLLSPLASPAPPPNAAAKPQRWRRQGARRPTPVPRCSSWDAAAARLTMHPAASWWVWWASLPPLQRRLVALAPHGAPAAVATIAISSEYVVRTRGCCRCAWAAGGRAQRCSATARTKAPGGPRAVPLASPIRVLVDACSAWGAEEEIAMLWAAQQHFQALDACVGTIHVHN